MAALLNLLDLLKYELAIAEAEAGGFDYPPDGLRGFDIIPSLLRPETFAPPDFPAAAQRKFLLEAIAAQEAGQQLPEPPEGWRLDRVAWNAVTRFAFLEYYFFYAYNDFERYQTAIFDNEHEGDDEGCCLVFDRQLLGPAGASSDGQAILRVAPTAIITSVHEEYQDADILKFIPPPLPDPANPNRRRGMSSTSPSMSPAAAMPPT